MVRELESAERFRDAPAFWPSHYWMVSLALTLPLVGATMVTNWVDGAHPVHVLVELVAMTSIALLAVFAVRQGKAALARVGHQLAELRDAVARSHAEVERTRAESLRWRVEAQQAMRGLAEAIDRQFQRWDLSLAEREVALLLLKGFSLKEIARLRGTTERTARDQARATYRKAGVAGRSELSAFFLEDLLLPPSPAARREDG